MPPRISDTGVITGSSLILMAVLAVITVLGILWGIRLKRARREADRIEIDRVDAESGEEQAGSSLTQAAPTGSAATTPMQPPVAPPPPFADTPVVGASAPVPGPAAEPIAIASEPAGATFAGGDRPVTDIKGLGPKVAARLAELGMTTVARIAALDAGEAERLDAQLGPFTGRLARDRWIEQARFLAAGDVKGFEAVFGRL